MTTSDGERALRLSDYATVLFDVDGTVVVGRRATPGARTFIRDCRRVDAAIGFVTNASMPTVHELRALLAAECLSDPGDLLLTAPTVMAREIVRRGFRTVVCAGHRGLSTALRAVGLTVIPIEHADTQNLTRHAEAVAVALGLFPQQLPPVRHTLEELLGSGAACFVPTMEPHWPTPSGLQPGNGQTVASLRESVSFTPIICGKPTALFSAELKRSHPLREPVLVVGDTWSADVALAHTNGWHSLLLLTGSTTRREAIERAMGEQPPTFIYADLVAALRTVR